MHDCTLVWAAAVGAETAPEVAPPDLLLLLQAIPSLLCLADTGVLEAGLALTKVGGASSEERELPDQDLPRAKPISLSRNPPPPSPGETGRADGEDTSEPAARAVTGD